MKSAVTVLLSQPWGHPDKSEEDTADQLREDNATSKTASMHYCAK